MDENNPPENQSSPPNTPPGKDPAREAKQAADAKAEEVRAQEFCLAAFPSAGPSPELLRPAAKSYCIGRPADK